MKIRRAGPSLDQIRRAHGTLRKIILERYGNVKTAFKEVDTDQSGKLRRMEVSILAPYSIFYILCSMFYSIFCILYSIFYSMFYSMLYSIQVRVCRLAPT